MSSLQLYYQILGIDENASIDEIKKSFRIKAKQYHPDFNTHPDAQKQFIETHEAYEQLLYQKTGLFYNTVKNKYQRSKISAAEISSAAKKRAEAFANTSYKKYKQSSYYAKSKAAKEASYFVELIFYFIVVIIIPTILAFFIGVKYAFYAALGVVVVTMPDWIPTLASSPTISIQGVKEGLKLLHWPKVTLHGILLFAACIIYVTIGFRTFITLDDISVLYGVLYVISIIILVAVKKYSTLEALFSSLSFAFFALNLILLLNYIISFDPLEERYSYTPTSVKFSTKRGKTYYGKGTLIRLLNDKRFYTYDDYMSVRFFWFYDSIANEYDNDIIYTTKKGWFYKVYTDRAFCEKPKNEF
jgi:hypothetical protein